MADYTVIVDDHDSRFIYGPSQDSWAVLHSSSTYQQTIHHTTATNATLSFSFIGGREIFIRGKYIEDNNASKPTTCPVFHVDSQYTLHCSPKMPQKNAEFLCSTGLPSTITNRTLTLTMDPQGSTQPFHIDYIRHGSNSQAAATGNGAPIYVKAPNNTTLGLSFQGNWQYQSIGGTNDIKKAMYTATASSTATYRFTGSSFTWWGCCMPAGTPNHAANVTYRVDGGDTLSVQLDKNFIQSAQCKDEKILFQIQPDTLNNNSHTLEVAYNSDDTTMPLTLCALAATPLDLNVLDVQPSNSGPSSTFPSSSSIHLPAATSPLTGGNDHGNSTHHTSHIGIIAGVICGGVFALIILFVSIMWWRRKRAKQERRSSATDFLSPFSFQPGFGFLDTREKRNPTALDPSPVSVMASPLTSTVSTITDEQARNSDVQSSDMSSSSSRAPSKPPSYRTTGSVLNV